MQNEVMSTGVDVGILADIYSPFKGGNAYWVSD